MQKQRSGVLDFVKIVATILILFHHYQQVMGVRFETINFFGGTNFYFGNIVELFFVISGIVIVPQIMEIEQGEDFATFFRKRFFRFFPVLVVSTIVYTVLVIVFYTIFGGWFLGDQINLFEVFISAFGAQVLLGEKFCAINSPIWYVSVLLVCYVMLYFCIWLAKRINVKSEYLYIAAITIGMMLIIRGIDFPIFCSKTGRGFVSFFSGILWEKYYFSGKKRNIWITVFVIVTTALMVLSPLTGAAEGGVVSVFLGIAYFPALIGCVKTDRMERIFSGKLISQMAAFSFEAYIWHSAVYMILLILLATNVIAVNMNSLGMMVFVAVLVEIFAMAMYYLVERPIRRRINNKQEKPLA